ncbi:hypothetical protein ABEB36_007872 [Hypothenemus hampei]|uniref:DUF7869 domain-containing protein n=1 Tax=Hypothenemus hampei TaxID=57062 RepID=A0ABD1EVD6_HYPHA
MLRRAAQKESQDMATSLEGLLYGPGIADIKIKIKQDSEQKENREEVLALAFDFMQNIQLPKSPVNEIFYYQQLTVCIFDNCWGQNKNHTVIRMLLALTDSRIFSKVLHNFPVRGHSFLPCYRDFALIKKELNKLDRIFTVHQITEIIIRSAKTIGKFSVKEVEATDIIDCNKWWQEFYKNNSVTEESKTLPRSEAISFNISGFSCFKYTTKLTGNVKVYPYIDGLVSHNFSLLHPGVADYEVNFPTHLAYPRGMIPIKKLKMDHIKKYSVFVDKEHKPFFDVILEWPTNNNPDKD